MRSPTLARWLSSGTFILAALIAGPAWSQPEPDIGASGLDPNGLARYAPDKDLQVYLEFQGVETYPDAWRRTAASQILQDTQTGEMLGEILTQIVNQGLEPMPGGKLSGEDARALVQHALNAGFLYAQYGPAEKPNTILVIRDAMREDSQQPLAHFLAVSGLAGSETEVTEKSGGRRVASNKEAPEAGWWVESGGDFVIAQPFEPVIATLESQKNASTHPERQALAEAEGDYQPVGLAFVEVASGSTTDQAASLGLKGLKRLTFRFGFEGDALRNEIQIVAPRSGLLDQPTFQADEIPAMPEGIESFTVLSLDLSKTYGAFADLIRDAGGPDSPATLALENFEKAIQKRTRKDLRGEILDQLGPKITYYTLPSEGPGGGAARPGLLPGLQVPRFVVAIQAKDARLFSATLAEMIGAFNDQSKEAASSPDDKEGGAGQAGSGQAKSRRTGQTVEFRMISVEPPTWMLSMPTALSALTNLRLAITIGKEHVLIAANPDAVREALAFEEKQDREPGPPHGALGHAIEGLTGPFILLNANDPSESRAESLSKLPATLQTDIRILAMSPLVRSAEAEAAAGAGSGRRDSSERPEEEGQGEDAEKKESEPSSWLELFSFKNLPRVQFRIPEESRPSSQAVASHLFPGSLAVVSEDQGLRIITREAFPNLGSGISGALGFIIGNTFSSPPPTSPGQPSEDMAEPFEDDIP